ncbi:GDSL-type esterase/lipase family protein [Pleomorphovibrio marinus]|uniref:GDSL-type esterase/lipase family protein n=1 Tax=Pleomorphovibrio marinus TaxID=2164132 RepID=UPI0013004086|nr:GDSL-type esterase/lipase family protein [Pleomorphovibrio marinus]
MTQNMLANTNYRLVVALVFLFFLGFSATAQEKFELRDGDRVVLLGSGIIENEQQYGWLESLFTSLWPDRYISFRNLGWSGDTVFGEARTYYTSQPSPFELLISQVKAVNPSLAILAYGMVESEKGEQGLATFTEGLNTLLDSLDKLSTKVVLLSPLSLTHQLKSEKERTTQDANTYYTRIKTVADERGLTHIDINPLMVNHGKQIMGTGVHLNEKGYAWLAAYIREALGFPIQESNLQIDWRKKEVLTSSEISNLKWENKENLFSLSLIYEYLPIPLPDRIESQPTIMVKGLKKGQYGLRINEEIVAVGTHQEWEKGIVLQQGPGIRQSERLRETIQKKDEIYFRQYRPQNRTYILGFRAYEQGRHEEDLKDLDLLVAWLDGQINQLKQPQQQQLYFFSIQ